MKSPIPLVGAPSAGAAAATTPRRPLPAHTWTGDAACYLPRPAQPPTIAGTTPKPGHGGTWLRATTPARLRIVAGARDGGAAAALELSLPKQLLLRRDLPAADGCCRSAGSDGSSALGTAWQAPRILEELGVLLIPQGAATFAFRFYDAQECATFQSSVAQLKSEAELALRASERAASAAAAGGQLAAAGTGGGPCPDGADATGAGGPAGAAGDAGGGRGPSDAQTRAAIRRFLSDPLFASYVARVEALWEEVEAELAG